MRLRYGGESLLCIDAAIQNKVEAEIEVKSPRDVIMRKLSDGKQLTRKEMKLVSDALKGSDVQW
jgi:hypothetical protein